EWVNPDREARRAVVGEHPLPHRGVGQVRRLDDRLERKRQLLLLSTRSGHARRTRHEPELPEELAPLQPEAVARTRLGERRKLVPGERRSLRELPDRAVRTIRFALADEGLRIVLSHALYVLEPDADGAVLELAADPACVHVGRPRLDTAPLRVAHERRRRLEA